MRLLRYWKKILAYLLVALISLSSGAVIGFKYCERLKRGSALSAWVLGVEAKKAGELDEALLYFGQAIALKRDEPLFLHSIGETFELKQNIPMALEFYGLALSKFKEEKLGGIKMLEEKIKILKEIQNKSK